MQYILYIFVLDDSELPQHWLLQDIPSKACSPAGWRSLKWWVGGVVPCITGGIRSDMNPTNTWNVHRQQMVIFAVVLSLHPAPIWLHCNISTTWPWPTHMLHGTWWVDQDSTSQREVQYNCSAWMWTGRCSKVTGAYLIVTSVARMSQAHDYTPINVQLFIWCNWPHKRGIHLPMYTY